MMSDLAIPCELPPEIWHLLIAMSFTAILFIYINVKVRMRKCKLCVVCKSLHLPRPPEMNAYDFWVIFCDKEQAC
jgi:hypothetical protein